ncbi:MAG: hypothetical protein HQK61_01065 [Desulfamplus sp.]|nr:hypothetical protein [Desulfamplus sp.]
MKPVFFPFTSITEYDARSVLSFFETFSYLSTKSDDELMASEPEWFQRLWKKECCVEPVTLDKEELSVLLASVKSWRSWAEANHGTTTRSGYLQSIFRQTPFFTSDTDIVSIRSQISRGIRMAEKDNSLEKFHTNPKDSSIKDSSIPVNQYPLKENCESTGNCESPVNRALLFLRLAMMTDIENESIDHQLSSIERLEANLFAELKGDMESQTNNDEPDEISGIDSKEDRGSLMTEHRLRCWLDLFMAKQPHFNDSTPNLFVTTSRSVIDFLLSVIEKIKLMLDIDNFKVHKEKKSSHAGAWSETFEIQWNKDFHIAVQEALSKGTLVSGLSKEESLINSNMHMNIADYDLFQFAGQSLTVMLVGVKK